MSIFIGMEWLVFSDINTSEVYILWDFLDIN